MTKTNVRPAPEKILLFGASGHVGGPAAATITAAEPAPELRLATSSAEKAAELKASFPSAEVVQADYTDLQSLVSAFDGVDAAFIITPDFRIDERQAVINVSAAAHAAGTQPHLVKLTGVTIGINSINDLRPALRDFPGPSLQYQQARAVLNASGLPVTFLNCFANYMDDFLTVWGFSLLTRGVLAAPYDRSSLFVDPRDVGEAAARLLLQPHSREHDGYVRHITGTERIRFSEVAALMTEVLGVDIAYEDDPQTFKAELGEVFKAQFGPSALDWLLAFSENEQKEEVLFIVTDELRHLLGREPRTLREWIEENRHFYLAEGSALRR
ncbi:MAG TPA: NmrA family NAD(P)-binding protein [Amycolatopsis sp.]|uniref:NmrA family NAD(P)-binding protein n=1 Tax=Amycolatopsis sp. TaxID=37632 RepID=UPI002B484C1E|nr:NmrA family NAD(P)-binding protein [Amycolatopsis sp.]HKS49823.1 NmrA family NAD(P)-binding protein [Amycolatopsis sp.]